MHRCPSTGDVGACNSIALLGETHLRVPDLPPRFAPIVGGVQGRTGTFIPLLGSLSAWHEVAHHCETGSALELG